MNALVGRPKRRAPRLHRKAKEAALLALDLVTAHEEIRPRREPYVRELGAQHNEDVTGLLEHNPVRDFLDLFERDCPAYDDRMRAVPRTRIEAALAAWKHPRGQSARKSTEPRKMAAVEKLLAAIGIECEATSLAVLWSQLGASGRVHWRSNEWFRAWGAKRAASVKG